MAKKEDRSVIHLVEVEKGPNCRSYRYSTSKNRRNDPGRLELRKYCPDCRQHKLFRETR